MNDTKEVVLYFEEDTKFNTVDVAKELLSRYNELGNPMLLPENSKNKNVPLILFNTNPSFQIQITSTSLSFLIDHTYFDKISSIIFDMVDTFEDVKCKFVRMGIVTTTYLAPKTVEAVKKKYLVADNLPDISNFNLSWYREIENKYGKLNCWERIINDTQDFKDLLIQFDINSKKEEKIDFNMKYIKEFIKISESIVEDRTNL